MTYNCCNCGGRVIFHEGYNHGWGHIIATGCVKPAVNIRDWKRYLQEKRGAHDKGVNPVGRNI